MHQKVLLLLVSLFSTSYACWGGAGVPPIGINSKMLNFSNKEIWNGWDAPPGAQEAWKEWLTAFNQSHQKSGYLTEEERAKGVLPAGHGEPGWPPDWIGLNEGFGGIEPPPWAYAPKNLGKPGVCYLQPLYGNCYSNLYRWGYNPFMDECQSFRFSGCGGNNNNFLTKESCERECVNPVMGCDPDSGIPEN